VQQLQRMTLSIRSCRVSYIPLSQQEEEDDDIRQSINTQTHTHTHIHVNDLYSVKDSIRFPLMTASREKSSERQLIYEVINLHGR